MDRVARNVRSIDYGSKNLAKENVKVFNNRNAEQTEVSSEFVK